MEHLAQDDVASIALARGWMNLSAYAREILPRISEKLWKDVDPRSVIVALSRIDVQTDLEMFEPMHVDILHVSLHTGLQEATYERTDKVLAAVRRAYKEVESRGNTFFTVTQSMTEVTLIAEKTVFQKFARTLKTHKPIFAASDLVGVTIKFDIQYLDVPGLIYFATRALTFRSINIIEIVSTTTEITFIIKQEYGQRALDALTSTLTAPQK